ncbi:VCBS [Rhodopseudomonas palustris HaA2]|uniref:VCBS n=1 Tax=Rhodopseudomonas palustris (strain HaA2) TaxID=316058 RepID=Q2IZL5_RHOP2|nr:VCBS domain-containing protein [Rhodopseudomonas palustris]ABD06345.1 VCBS [Rhodopseudomonas palustris HaA2]
MNALIKMAQLQLSEATTSAVGLKTFKVSKPETGQALAIQLDGKSVVDLTSFADEKITLVRLGNRLVILFDNQSTVTINPFYDALGRPIADVSLQVSQGQPISGAEFVASFPISTDQSILPAAGAGGPAPVASSASFSDITIDQLNPSGNGIGSRAPVETGVVTTTIRDVFEPGSGSPLGDTNDAAVITGTSTASLLEADVVLGTGGTLVASDPDSSNAFVPQAAVAGSNGYGNFSIDAAGVWTYAMTTPHNEFVGGVDYTDSVTVATVDGTTQVVTVTITGTDDATVITGASTATLIEADVVLSTGGTLVASDPDSSNAFVPQAAVAGSNGYGNFSIDAAGVWTYAMTTPHNEFVGGVDYTDSVTVATVDGTTQLLTVTITGTDDATVIAGFSTATLTEADVVLSTGGTLVASDPDSSNAFVPQAGVAGSNGYGSFSIDAAGVWTYSLTTAHDEFVGGFDYTDSMTVATVDGTTQLVTVTITGTNDAAVITGTSTASLVEADAVLTTGGTLVASDIDNLNAFVVQTGVAGSNGYGTFSIDASGAWTYSMTTAHDEFVEGVDYTDSITVTTVDGTTQLVTVTITGTDDATVVSSADVSVAEGNAPISTGGTLTISDVDSAVTFVAQPGTPGAHGIFSIGTNGAWTYVANDAFDGLNVGQSVSDTFSVSAADGTLTSVQVTITGTNDLAFVSSADVSVAEDNAPISTGGTLTISDVDSAATFVEQSGTPGVHGIFSIGTNGAWTYVANDAFESLSVGQSVSDTFSVSAADGTLTSVQVTITGTNDAPVITVASPDSSSASLTESDAALTASGTLTVTDVDVSNTVTASVQSVVVAGPSGGLSSAALLAMLAVPGAAIAADPTDAHNLAWTFNSAPQAFDFLAQGETLSLTYTVGVQDGAGGSDTQTVTVTVAGTNDTPVLITGPGYSEPASQMTGAVTEDAAANQVRGIVNVFDADNGHGLTAVIDNPNGTYGTLARDTWVDGNGDTQDGWVYTLDNTRSATQALKEGEVQTETFTFKVMDEHGAIDTETVTITVTGNNDAPIVAHAITNQTLLEDHAWTFQVPADTFADVDGPPLEYSAFLANGDPLPDGMHFDPATLTFTGTPPLNETHSPDLKVVAWDGEFSAEAYFTLNITPVNDAPAGTNGAVTTLEDIAYTLTLADFGYTDANDDPANTLLGVKITTLPGAGTLALDGHPVTAGATASAADILAGKLQFVPAANANGSNYASFTFQVQDDGGTANGGVDLDPLANTLTINVTPVNDAPVLSGHENPSAIAEDSGAAGAATTVAHLLGLDDVNPANDHAIDVDAASLGIVITAVDDSHGVWQFQSGGGTWTDVDLAPGEGLHLAQTDALRFIPSRNVQTTDATLFDASGNPVLGSTNPSFVAEPPGLTFRAWDMSNGIAAGITALVVGFGGTSAYSATAETASLVVTGTLDRVFTNGDDTVDLTGLSNDPAVDAVWFEDQNFFDAGEGDDNIVLPRMAGPPGPDPLAPVYQNQTFHLGAGDDTADASATIGMTILGGDGADRTIASAETTDLAFAGGGDESTDVLQVDAIADAIVDKTGTLSGNYNAFDVGWNGSRHVVATEIEHIEISGTGAGSTLTVLADDFDPDPVQPHDERIAVTDQSVDGFTVEFAESLEQVRGSGYGRLLIDGRRGDDSIDFTGLKAGGTNGLNDDISALEVRGGEGEDQFVFGVDSVAATVVGGLESDLLRFGGDTVIAKQVGDAVVDKTGTLSGNYNAFDVSWNGSRHVTATEIERVEISGTGAGSTLTVLADDFDPDPAQPQDERIEVTDQSVNGFTVEFAESLEQVQGSGYGRLVIDGRRGDDSIDLTGLKAGGLNRLNDSIDAVELRGGEGEDRFVFGVDSVAATVIGGVETDLLRFGGDTVVAQHVGDAIVDKTGMLSGNYNAFDVSWGGSRQITATEIERIEISGTGAGSTLTVLADDFDPDPGQPGDERIEVADDGLSRFTIGFAESLEQVQGSDYDYLVMDGRGGDDMFDLSKLTAASGLTSVELTGGDGRDEFILGSANPLIKITDFGVGATPNDLLDLSQLRAAGVDADDIIFDDGSNEISLGDLLGGSTTNLSGTVQVLDASGGSNVVVAEFNMVGSTINQDMMQLVWQHVETITV